MLAAAGSQAISEWTAQANFCVLLRVPYEKAKKTQKYRRLGSGHRVRDLDASDKVELVSDVPYWIILQVSVYFIQLKALLITTPGFEVHIRPQVQSCS